MLRRIKHVFRDSIHRQCTTQTRTQPRETDGRVLPFCWQRLLFGNHWNIAVERISKRCELLSRVYAKQCNIIAAQKLRRTIQVAQLYQRLYDKQSLRKALESIGISFSRNRNLGLVLGAVLFSWDQEKITEENMKSCGEEIYLVKDAKNKDTKDLPDDHFLRDWDLIINKDHLMAWRRPVPNTSLYEYKVYGTFRDIPARAFYDVQIDLDFRKQWDKLVINLDIVDKDTNSGCEVVRWVTHFPYPMYSREYVYVRKTMVDQKNNTMILMSQATDHPCCPVDDKKYVRVSTFESHLVIKPHTTIDENGFDYILTYCDDPQAAFPTPCYNWMASTGVPDFVNKLHKAAQVLHERRSQGRYGAEESSEGHIAM